MRSINAASVEDLPDPVPPVTRMMPLRTFAASSNCGGRRSELNVGIDGRNDAHHNRATSALDKDIDAEARHSRQSIGDVAGTLLAKRIDCLLVIADQIGGDAARVVRRKGSASGISTPISCP